MVDVMTDTISPTTGSPTTGILPLKPGRWALDVAHVNVAFSIGHLGVSKVRGRFGDVDAELVVGETLADTAVNATVGTTSLDTGNSDRDAHVLTNEFLDAENRPSLSFRSTNIAGDGDSWTMNGDLTIGNVTKPVTFDVVFGGVAPFYDGTFHAGFGAKGAINRQDFGITFGQADGLLGDIIDVELDLEFLQPN
jgi:polyisoprenoid-binding protein YceI